ncbi:MAG: hypothetical protein COW30_06025 [Rhodospirillales bacterium CG15_BIG_FIL_POST_REV_8_21_14_020_66_15]|nr:MAG: hypothetical protein COW30_06025 [Rhodospirillales bacterium CG15_BIG_FIL_POST_REV_8_21_14_020_66_15]
MLGKMIIHGLVAATVIGAAAAVYAQTRNDGYASPAPSQVSRAASPGKAADDGYMRPTGYRSHERDDDDHEHGFRRGHERRDRVHSDHKRGHDRD